MLYKYTFCKLTCMFVASTNKIKSGIISKKYFFDDDSEI